ncbi:MAG: hypothetical protein HQ581_07490 [Planctomycetes bacterium]|nr:hypothetical protein [Planctomycetota bacterium]
MNTATLIRELVVTLCLVVAGVPMASADNLPLPPGQEKTPETRTPSADEAARVLQRDWLFQATGEPLLERAGKEMVWTQALAARLSRGRQGPDLSAELQALTVLEKRLAELRVRPAHLRPVGPRDTRSNSGSY